MRIALSAGGRYSGVTLYLPHAARHRHRRIRYPVFGIRSLASGLWHPASIHRASRPHGLFHNFCWQACGHPEHPPSNTLIRRHFPETVRNAASRLKSVRRAPHGRRPPPNRPAASPRRQSSTTHFRRSSFPQFLCANLWISRAAARQAIDPSELFAILVPAAETARPSVSDAIRRTRRAGERLYGRMPAPSHMPVPASRGAPPSIRIVERRIPVDAAPLGRHVEDRP